MNIPTPTHETYIFGLIILTLLSISSFIIPMQIATKLPRWRYNNIMMMNAIIKSLIVLYGCFFISLSSLFPRSLMDTSLCVFFAFILGFFIIKIEGFFYRAAKIKKTFSTRPVIREQQRLLSLTSSRKKIKTSRYAKSFSDYALNWHAGIFILVLIALSEEIIFRGFLVTIALHYLHGFAEYGLMALSIIIFGFAHYTMGLSHMWLKGFYGFIFLLLALALHTILAGLIAHIILNVNVWYVNKK